MVIIHLPRHGYYTANRIRNPKTQILVDKSFTSYHNEIREENSSMSHPRAFRRQIRQFLQSKVFLLLIVPGFLLLAILLIISVLFHIQHSSKPTSSSSTHAKTAAKPSAKKE